MLHPHITPGLCEFRMSFSKQKPRKPPLRTQGERSISSLTFMGCFQILFPERIHHYGLIWFSEQTLKRKVEWHTPWIHEKWR